MRNLIVVENLPGGSRRLINATYGWKIFSHPFDLSGNGTFKLANPHGYPNGWFGINDVGHRWRFWRDHHGYEGWKPHDLEQPAGTEVLGWIPAGPPDLENDPRRAIKDYDKDPRVFRSTAPQQFIHMDLNPLGLDLRLLCWTEALGLILSVSKNRAEVLYSAFKPIRSCLFHPIRAILALSTDDELIVYSLSEGQELRKIRRSQP
jgi:hypothetical protein